MQKAKILIVDDEKLVQNVCVSVLQKHGFEPIVAVNGLDGLEAYRAQYDEIVLTLADVSMPVMGGIEMVRSFFKIHSHANVILMSGHVITEMIPDEVRRLCSVLQKPFTSKQLIQAVKKCLKYDDDHHSAV